MRAVAINPDPSQQISQEQAASNVAAAIAANPAAAQFLPQNNQVDPTTFNTTALTPDIANDLMWRSMTTGVPTSEFYKYGGYDAVSKFYNSNGGQYDLSTIPSASLNKYAQTVADTGVGNLAALTQANLALPQETISRMLENGIDPTFLKPFQDQLYQNNLVTQTDPMKSAFESIYKDDEITWDEAQQVRDYSDKYNFKPEDIARVTGLSIDKVNRLLDARGDLLESAFASDQFQNPLNLVNFAIENKLTANDLSSASNGTLTKDQAQALLDKGSTYAGRVEMASPDAYNQIKNLSMYTANENFGGNVQDYQVQLFTPLDTTKIGVPKQLEFTERKTDTVSGYNDNGTPYEYERELSPATVKTAGVEPIYEYANSEDSVPTRITGYESTTPVNINGVPVFATYDADGQLTGYVGDRRVTTWLDGKNRVVGNWDAEGKPNPSTMTSSGGGFIKGLGNDVAEFTSSLGPAWTIAKIAFPELNLVDVGSDVARSEVNLNTGVKGALGYAGMQNSAATDLTNPNSVNATSGVDIGSGVSPAVQMTQNAQYAKLGAAGVTAVQAADQGNYAPLLALSANVAGINKMPGAAVAANTLAAANAISTNNPAALMSAAGNLTGSSDLKLAGAATNFIKAYESGNQAAIAVAGMAFSSAVNANAPAASKTIRETLFGPAKIDTSGLKQGSPITPSGPSEDTSASVYSQAILAGATPEEAYRAAQLAGGIKLASTDGSLPEVEIGGAPIFAGTARASTVTEPVGYRLMTMEEADARPAGSYYDITQNAWLTPDEGGMDEIKNLRDSLAGQAPAGYGTDVTGLDNSTSSSGLSGAASTSGSSSGNMGEVTVTGGRPTTEIPEMVITADRPVTEIPEMVITADRPVADVAPATTQPTAATPTTVTPPVPITKTPTTGGSMPTIASAAALVGYIPPALKESLIKNKITSSKFENPLKHLKDIQEAQEATEKNMIQNGIDPQLAAILSAKAVQSVDQPQQNSHFTYGQEDSIDDILGKSDVGGLDQAFADGGYVQPLALAPGGLSAPLMAAAGGLPSKAKGREDFRTSKHVAGEGDGHSDDIPAMLADGEFVFSADVVSALGNGSTKAGSDKLYKMVEEIRKRARSTSPDKLAPPALKSPLDYLKKR